MKKLETLLDKSLAVIKVLHEKVVLPVGDFVYGSTCGGIDCPYCAFFRGLLLGLIVGIALGMGLVATDIIAF